MNLTSPGQSVSPEAMHALLGPVFTEAAVQPSKGGAMHYIAVSTDGTVAAVLKSPPGAALQNMRSFTVVIVIYVAIAVIFLLGFSVLVG